MNYHLVTESLLKEAKVQGIKINIIEKNFPIIVLSKNGKQKYLIGSKYFSNASGAVRYICREKPITKFFLDRGGVRTPEGTVVVAKEFVREHNFLEHLQLPVICKPTNASLSRDVYVIHDKRELFDKVNQFCKNDMDCIVEEYIPG